MMPEPTEAMIARNLAQAIERLQEDLDRVELWTAALGCFQRPVPDYTPGDRYLLPARELSPETKRNPSPEAKRGDKK
jgi:hypothetical protein